MMRIPLFSRRAATALSLALATALSPVRAQTEPYVGQLMLTASNYCPANWMPADGSVLPIRNYQDLFAQLGTTYGGNGSSNFQLPDLRGRAPISIGQGNGLNNFVSGQFGGQESVNLSVAQLPSHTHTINLPTSSNAATHSAPANTRVLAQAQNAGIYADAAGANTSLASISSGASGSGATLYLRNPYLAMLWCICVNGVYPPRS